jgi:hypothetical protein
MLYRHVEKSPTIEVDKPDVSGPMLDAIWRSEVAGSGEVNVLDCALRSKFEFGLGLGFVNGSHGENGCKRELFLGGMMALSAGEGTRALSSAKASQNALWVMKLSFLNCSQKEINEGK